MNIKKTFLITIFLILNLTSILQSQENKILIKVNNEIITSLDILNELKYLKAINKQFKETNKLQSFEIAKRSLIREKIKENELKKRSKEIKLEDQFINNLLVDYFRNIQVNSISDFENYFNSINIDPNLIKKKITIEVMWNQLIFRKYSQSVKIDRQAILNDLKKNNKQKEFLLSEILLSVNENESLDEKFKLIKDKIEKTNFAEAALMYSVADTASKGGELNWIKETSMSLKIKESIQNIDVGNYTDPIIVPGGFLILKIRETRQATINTNLDEEIEKIVRDKSNEQLNQFSNIFFNKIKKNIIINEL